MNILKNKYVIALAVGLMLVTAACDNGPAEDSAQGKTQKVTEEYSQVAIEAVPYPQEQMQAGGWLERRNVRERLVRYADPNKIS
jgi:hypothetical protein